LTCPARVISTSGTLTQTGDDGGRADAPLLPPLEDLPSVSRRIALAVGVEARRQGLAPQAPPEEWERALEARRWEPRYLSLRPDKTGGTGAR
jgi:hypothetical protein